MTQERDIERLLDHWFSDGPDAGPRSRRRHRHRPHHRPVPATRLAPPLEAHRNEQYLQACGCDRVGRHRGGHRLQPLARFIGVRRRRPDADPRRDGSAHALPLADCSPDPDPHTHAHTGDGPTKGAGRRRVVDGCDPDGVDPRWRRLADHCQPGLRRADWNLGRGVGGRQRPRRPLRRARQVF